MEFARVMEGFEVTNLPLRDHSLGRANETGAVVSATAIAKEAWTWAKRYPNQLPLVETLIDAISGTSTHELIHFIGHVRHKKIGKVWSQADFRYLTAVMGHPSGLVKTGINTKLALGWGKKERGASRRFLRGLVVIDVDNDPE